MESRIKQLREKRGLIQEILAVELGITHQCNNRLFAGSFRCKKRFEWADENE